MIHPHALIAAERREIFAEILSETGDVTATARAMGIPRNRANKYLAHIRRGLGPQAC